MTATAETIWQVPAYLPYLQPPLTEEAVSAAEEEIGYELPIEYLKLLKKQNGGYIRYSLPGQVHDLIFGIGPNFPALRRIKWDEPQEYVSFPLQGLVPFDGDGHWHLCLDYRHNPKIPSVTLADIECDQVSGIAAAFGDYLGKLVIDVSEEYVLEGNSEIEQLKAVLSVALGITFDPADLYAHGYPTYRGRLGQENNREWVWVTPNNVPRGFVRSDDARYVELKDLMPGIASRFPEAPADSFILSATDSLRVKAVQACVQAGMTIRPLRDYVRGS